MGFLTKILGPTIKDVGDLIGKFVTDPDKKLEAQLALAKLEQDVQTKLIEADVEWAKAQAEVIKSEATSESWLTANWRPLLMTVFTYIILHTYVLVPVFAGWGLKGVGIPTEMWDLLKMGVSGYIVGRSAEKIAPDVAKIFKK